MPLTSLSLLAKQQLLLLSACLFAWSLACRDVLLQGLHVTGCSNSAVVVSGRYNLKDGLAQATPALHIIDSIIADNTASSKGGGIHATRAAVFMKGVELSENAAALFGGAVSIESGLLVMHRTTMKSNRAGLGKSR